MKKDNKVMYKDKSEGSQASAGERDVNVEGNGDLLQKATESEYKYGFTSDIDTDIVPPGLNEDVIRYISKVKGEPEWLLDFRLKAYRHWLTLPVPH